MIFDVMVREGFNEKGKQIINVYRYHDSMLSQCLRNIQDAGSYIVSVIPLFRNKYTQQKNSKPEFEEGLTERDKAERSIGSSMEHVEY